MTRTLLLLAQSVNFELPKVNLDAPTITNALRLVFGFAGGIALLVVTLAGLQYVLSRGDPQAIAKAKNTILYALAGLVVCIFAFTIVSFVLRSLQ